MSAPEEWVPQFEGQRPPFQPGNRVAVGNRGPVEHGVFSPRTVEPLAGELVERVLDDPDTTYLRAPRWRPAIEAWAKAEAQAALLERYLATAGSITGDGVGDLDDERVRTAYALLHRAAARATTGRTRLGLDPLSAARLGRDAAAGAVDVAKVMAEMERRERESGGDVVSGPSLSEIDRARRDPAVFAELLVGAPLWSHQAEVVRSAARYRVICAGRRAGKTRLFGVLALHQAFAVARSRVLIVSAGDVASKRMFADIASMAGAAPLLRGSVADETKSLLTLSNGSTIECVPASMAQVRSAEADLLIVDEAGFVAQSIWEAAEPTVVARAGSRVLLCSTPWGGPEHFFRALWRQGMDRPDVKVASWHWPSSVSPLVDDELLEDIRSRSSPLYFAREFEAAWSDAAGGDCCRFS